MDGGRGNAGLKKGTGIFRVPTTGDPACTDGKRNPSGQNAKKGEKSDLFPIWGLERAWIRANKFPGRNQDSVASNQMELLRKKTSARQTKSTCRLSVTRMGGGN